MYLVFTIIMIIQPVLLNVLLIFMVKKLIIIVNPAFKAVHNAMVQQ